MVPRSGTSMRNPLQATKWRSCGTMQIINTKIKFPKGGLKHPTGLDG